MSQLTVETPDILAPDAVPASRWTSPWRRPTVIFGRIVTAIWLIVLFTVQWWAPYSPLEAAGA